ncbi:MAG: rhomboid family intramembrane serine protease [Candidatus Hydrogenedens sp.]|nr:rhomboid family intramembrane serine protease [Candidatus Hydrogenedens sp.]
MSYYYQRYYVDNLSFFRPTITRGVRNLILINILIFIFELFLGLVMSALISIIPMKLYEMPMGYMMLFQLFGFNIPLFLRGALWQIITYMFIHSGLYHLFFNMLWLYIFGPEVEIYFSKKRFYIFYLFCGATAVLVNFIPFVFQGYTPPIVGASGSIMAVLVAFAYINPEREFFLFPLPIPINARGIVILVILLNLLYISGFANMSIVTHLAGMGIGYLYISADDKGIFYKLKKLFGLNKFDV